MTYPELTLGPFVLENTSGAFPQGLTVNLSHGVDGQTRLSGSWAGPRWTGVAGPVSLQSAPTSPGVSLAVTKAQITNCTWAMSPNAGPRGTIEFQGLESIVRFRQADPSKRGMLVVYLTGLNFMTLNVDPVDVELPGRRWTLALLEPMLSTREHLRDATAERITATLSTELEAPVQMRPDLLAEASEISWLLSLAQGRRVRIARADVWTNEAWLIESTLWSGDSHGGVPVGPLPLDDVHVGDVMAPYLSAAIVRFRAYEDKLRLRALIGVLLLARRAQPTEAIALLCANFLEVLRHNYAQNVLAPSGRARLGADGDVLWPTGQNSGRRMHFAEIITAFSTDFGLSGWDGKFKELRNTVVHTGEVPGSTVLERWRNAMELMHFCDRAVLAILGIEALGLNYYRVGRNDYAKFLL